MFDSNYININISDQKLRKSAFIHNHKMAAVSIYNHKMATVSHL